MKPYLFSLLVSTLILVSCSDSSHEKTLKAKQIEAECKAHFSKQLYEHSDNITAALISEGYKTDLDAFLELQKDTTISCDSIKKSWDRLSAKVLN